jgi:hypothetical protein
MKNEIITLYSAHVHPMNAHGAGWYTSKCIEAVPAEDQTWMAGVPTRRSDHYAKSPIWHWTYATEQMQMLWNWQKKLDANKCGMARIHVLVTHVKELILWHVSSMPTYNQGWKMNMQIWWGRLIKIIAISNKPRAAVIKNCCVKQFIASFFFTHKKYCDYQII